jgi:hypothetical protein
MSNSTATLPQFQTYVWNMLPVRREAVGREIVDDIVLVAVQLWPSEALSQLEPGSSEEADELRRLAWSIRRILEFVYGSTRFNGYWLLGANSVVLIIIEVMRVWWRKRKDNRAKIGIWRRRWTHE